MTITDDHPTTFSAKLFHFTDHVPDPDGMVSLFTEDIRLRFGSAPVAEGKQAAREVAAQQISAFAGMRHKVFNEWRIDDQVILQLEVTYTRFDKVSITLPGVAILRLRGDLVSEYLIYVDPAPLYA